MIYSPNNKPLVLTKDAADAFLESVGVKLFEDTISIDGVMYEGSYGESILEENGIFLYEDGIVLEGMSKEDYLRTKEERQRNADEQHKKDAYNGSEYFVTPANTQHIISAAAKYRCDCIYVLYKYIWFFVYQNIAQHPAAHA